MSYQRYKSVSFGPSKGSLTTVGYTLNGVRATSGVAEIVLDLTALGHGMFHTGIYGATITFPSGYRGPLTWDIGDGASPPAAEEINPETDEYLDTAVSGIVASVWSTVIEQAVSGGQQLDASQMLALVGAVLAGVLSGEGTNTLTFAAAGNPTVARVVSAIASTGRTPTLTPPA